LLLPAFVHGNLGFERMIDGDDNAPDLGALEIGDAAQYYGPRP
jgi:hypothetical protein